MYSPPIYHIESEEHGRFAVTLDRNHPIFAAHFPGRPILPGAVILQMTADMVSILSESRLIMSRCRSVKFLKTVEPGSVTEVLFTFRTISEDKEQARLGTVVSSTDSSVIFARMDIDYRKI